MTVEKACLLCGAVQWVEESVRIAYSTACNRTPMRAQAVLDCGALRGAAKSYVLAVRIVLSGVFGSCNGCMRC